MEKWKSQCQETAFRTNQNKIPMLRLVSGGWRATQVDTYPSLYPRTPTFISGRSSFLSIAHNYTLSNSTQVLFEYKRATNTVVKQKTTIRKPINARVPGRAGARLTLGPVTLNTDSVLRSCLLLLTAAPVHDPFTHLSSIYPCSLETHTTIHLVPSTSYSKAYQYPLS